MKIYIKKYIFAIILFIVAIFFISLLFLLSNISYSDDAIEVNYFNSNKLNINNNLPVTDSVGKVISSENSDVNSVGYTEFEVRSSVKGKVKYEIFLEENQLDVNIPDKFVKVYLTDEFDVPLSNFDEASVPTYYDLRISDSDPNAKLLYSGTLRAKGSQKFILRIWIADTYELTTEDRFFSANLKVKVK